MLIESRRQPIDPCWFRWPWTAGHKRSNFQRDIFHYAPLFDLQTHSILMALFPGEPGLAGCPLILLLHLFLNCASFWDWSKLSMSFLAQSHQVFFGHPLSSSFNISRYTMFDPVIIMFSFNMSKPSQPTPFDHQTDWFQSINQWLISYSSQRLHWHI